MFGSVNGQTEAGHQWLLGGNVLCNILMACCGCFCRIVHGTYLSIPSHSNLCLSHPIGFPLWY